MKTFINEIEHERNTAAHIILFAESTSSILAVYPTKALARPHKRDPSKMTKASKNPWKLPGDKRKLGETMHETAARGLQEKTGMVFTDLDATLIASDTVFIAKDAVLMYSIPTELPVALAFGFVAGALGLVPAWRNAHRICCGGSVRCRSGCAVRGARAAAVAAALSGVRRWSFGAVRGCRLVGSGLLSGFLLHRAP